MGLNEQISPSTLRAGTGLLPPSPLSEHALFPPIFRSKWHQQVYISSKPRRGPPALSGLKTLATCPLGFVRFAPISPPHRTSMLHSRRRDRASPPAVLPKLHSASRKTSSPRRRVSITRPATAPQPGLARAQWPPQHAHMFIPMAIRPSLDLPECAENHRHSCKEEHVRAASARSPD